MTFFNRGTAFSCKRLWTLRIFLFATSLFAWLCASPAHAAECALTSGWKGTWSGPANPLLIPSNTPVGTLIATYSATVPNTPYADCAAGHTSIVSLIGAGPYGNASPVPGRAGMYSFAAAPGLGYIFKENGAVINNVGVWVQRNWTIGPGGGYYSYGAMWTIEVYKIGDINNYTVTSLDMAMGTQASGTLGVFGQLIYNSVASTCTVLTPNLGIPLGDIDIGIFTGVGTPSPTSPDYNLILNCQGKPNISMSVSGVSVPGNAGLFGLAAGNTATGIGVQLFRSGSAITPSQHYPVSSATPDGWLYIPIAARYVQTGDVGPGSANANMTATFTYN
jgi:type 1 fimbria pilin